MCALRLCSARSRGETPLWTPLWTTQTVWPAIRSRLTLCDRSAQRLWGTYKVNTLYTNTITAKIGRGELEKGNRRKPTDQSSCFFCDKRAITIQKVTYVVSRRMDGCFLRPTFIWAEKGREKL